MYRTLTFLGIAVLLLLAIGFVLIASASGANGVRLYGDPHHFIVKQAIALGAALLVFGAAWAFDYRKFKQYPWLTIAMYSVIVVLMVAVLFCPARNGSHRWIRLGGFLLQPSEFAKIVAVISMAVFIDRLGWRLSLFWKGVVPLMAALGLLVGLAVKEPDFGSAMVIALAGGVTLFVGGMKWLHIGVVFLTGVGGVVPVLLKNANRMRRIMAWMPDALAQWVPQTGELSAAEADDANHQLNMALVAIQRGGVTGVGFNQSMQKQYYLPEAHTDFIFAIGAEEFGLVFSLILLAAFVTLFICGLVIAAHAQDRLGRLIAYGVTFIIFFQAVFNIGVVTGCLPTKGLALPFISYGGTNLMAALAEVGLLFNIGCRTGLQNSERNSILRASRK